MVSAIRFGTPRRRIRVPGASPVWTPPPGGLPPRAPSPARPPPHRGGGHAPPHHRGGQSPPPPAAGLRPPAPRRGGATSPPRPRQDPPRCQGAGTRTAPSVAGRGNDRLQDPFGVGDVVLL